MDQAHEDILQLHGDYLFVTQPTRATSMLLKMIPGRVWTGTGWQLPCTRQVYRDLRRVLPQLFMPGDIDHRIEQALVAREARLDAAAQAKQSEGSTSMPIKGVPFLHQRRAHAMAMELFSHE